MMQVIVTQLSQAAAGHTKLELLEGFMQLLDELAPGERLAIIIDEAQELADETLEEFRLLSNLDTSAERRLQIVLVGQPELIERLASPAMTSLNERIGARVRLSPLPPSEMREYIDCRLGAKGGTAKKISFLPRSTTWLARARNSAANKRALSQRDAARVRGRPRQGQPDDGPGRGQ